MAFGQEPPAMGWNNSGTWRVPTFPGFGQGPRRLFEDELWTFRVDGRVGHQWMDFSKKFPYNSNPDPRAQRFAFERMDIELKDSNYWVGFTEVQVQPAQDLIAFARVGGNIPKQYSTITMSATGAWTRPANPVASVLTDANTGVSFLSFGPTLNGANTTSPWYWDTEFQWWLWEAGALVRLNSDFALELGYRTEHVDYRMINPRNDTTEFRPSALSTAGGNTTVTNVTFADGTTADFTPGATLFLQRDPNDPAVSRAIICDRI
jgi:hypothetical protein